MELWNLELNYQAAKDPINAQDIRWLEYIWESSSDGFDVLLNCDSDSILNHLKHTRVYNHLYQRFTFYKESKKLFEDFECRENNSYYIVLQKDFEYLDNLKPSYIQILRRYFIKSHFLGLM